MWGCCFLREIEIAAKLQHPHILPVYDSGQADGMLYYVMPFVEGESLRDRLSRGGPLPHAEAARIAREVADALAYAHRQGIVHRDIKPANILLSQGHAVVADFGVARAVSASAARSELTQTGMAVGTPTYMSPEQALGETNLDGRTDVYALGVVLYEMLAGSPPFEGATPQSIVAQALSRKAPPLAHDALGLEPVIERALAREPGVRFTTADELGGGVDALLGGPGFRGAGPRRTPARCTTYAAVIASRRTSCARRGVVTRGPCSTRSPPASWARAAPRRASDPRCWPRRPARSRRTAPISREAPRSSGCSSTLLSYCSSVPWRSTPASRSPTSSSTMPEGGAWESGSTAPRDGGPPPSTAANFSSAPSGTALRCPPGCARSSRSTAPLKRATWRRRGGSSRI